MVGIDHRHDLNVVPVEGWNGAIAKWNVQKRKF